MLLSFFKIILEIILIGSISDIVHQFVKVVHKAILFIMTVLSQHVKYQLISLCEDNDSKSIKL
jgi:hypothetical protein